MGKGTETGRLRHLGREEPHLMAQRTDRDRAQEQRASWPQRQRLGWDPGTSKPGADITPKFSEANGQSGFFSHLALTVGAQGCWALGRGPSTHSKGPLCHRPGSRPPPHHGAAVTTSLEVVVAGVGRSGSWRESVQHRKLGRDGCQVRGGLGAPQGSRAETGRSHE